MGTYRRNSSTGESEAKYPRLEEGESVVKSNVGPKVVKDFRYPPPEVQNVVATVNLGTFDARCRRGGIALIAGCVLDLKRIALRARNAEYNPRRFSAVIMRIREPRTTALLFNSGKVVVTGAKSEEEANLAARKYARIVQKLGYDVRFLEYKVHVMLILCVLLLCLCLLLQVQNIVGSTDVHFPIHLEKMALMHGIFVTYEPELFPGLIYRMVEPRVVLLIFVNGKVVRFLAFLFLH